MRLFSTFITYPSRQLRLAPFFSRRALCTRPAPSLTQTAPSSSPEINQLLHKKGYRPTDRVILFDGECVFCNSGVDFVLKQDTNRQFKFAALQSATGKALTSKYGCPSDLSTMVYIDNEQAYIRSDAMLQIGKRLGVAFALPSRVVIATIPKRIRDFVYTDVIAKYRYTVFGKRDECRLPDPAEKHRFLE